MTEGQIEGLFERSRLFDQVLSSITDLVYTFDLDGRFTFINKPLLDLWDMTLEEAVGKNFHELPYPTDLAIKLQAQIQEVIDTKERMVDETSYTDVSGSTAYYQYIFSPVFDQNGEVEAVAGSTRDISNHKRLATQREESVKELQAERANLSELIKQAPSFICLLRGTDHVFELANDRYLDLVGRRDIVGKPIDEALPEIRGQGFFELLDKVYQTGEPYIGDEIHVDVGPEGNVSRRILNFVYQALRGPDGEITGVFVHGVDVTDLVNSRRALSESRERGERQRRLYEAILNNTPDLAYVWDLNHRFTYANDGLLQMWGQTAENAIGKNCLELGYEQWHAEMHSREIDQVAATKQPIRGEVPFNGTFGRRIYDYILVPVIGEDGQVEAVAGTTRDITDRVVLETKLSEQAEMLVNESRRKDEFLAMLSHELRNPLAPISSAVHLLRTLDSGLKNPIQQQAQEIIERQVGNLTKIVNDLLEVSRVVSGRIRLELQVVDLNQVMTHSIETVSPLLHQRNHALTVNLCDEPLWASIDPTRIEEVLVNILNNAAKYTENGGKIEVTCERSAESDVAKIRVRDNGVGIEEKLLPEIFDLFTQADRSLDRSAGGLGIGLSLANRLVNLHGGQIEAYSPPQGIERGSEFVVTLPLTAATDLPQSLPETAPASNSGQGLNVLVVDDNVDLVMMLASSLRQKGHTVQSAYNGHDGVDVARRLQPDVIILDVGLPGLNGYEVAKILRSDPVVKDAKLIALTGYGRESDVAAAKEAGFDVHVNKPYVLDDLERLFYQS